MASDTNSHRLREILSVLRKHKITRGLTPVKLRMILEDLGPTYVKLGQIMSMRSDMLPEKYCLELTKLRTDVRPFPFEEVERVIEQEFSKKPEKIFSSIDRAPSGSASIAQVHPAVLMDGRKVVIKVQRPAIKEIMANDIHLMKKAVRILKLTIGTGDLIDFRTILDELWKTAQEEMDFIREASNLKRFYENQKNIRYVTCPRVVEEFTTGRLLVMDYLEGVQIDHTEELLSLGYDMTEIGTKAAENYCKQILEDGFFHADPHPGNLWVSGGKIAWLDLGMTGELSEHHKQLLKRAIIALLKNDMYELKNVLLAFGEAKERINHARLYTDVDDIVSKYAAMGFGNMNLGELIEKMLDLVKRHHIAVSPDITLLGRSMITMEGTLTACAPQVNIMQILTNHMSSLLLDEMDFKKELKHKGRLLYTSVDKSLTIPALLSDLLNITKNGQTKLNVEFSDTTEIMEEVRHISNRFILGLLASALFIGSGILCMTGLQPLIFHMPWISFLGFSLSGILILYLLLRMLFRK